MGQHEGQHLSESASLNEKIFYVCESAKVVGIVFCVVVLYLLRSGRKKALIGDASTASTLILPAFEPLILLLLAALIMEGLINLASFLYEVANTSIAFDSIYEWIRDGFTLLFLEKSLSSGAMRRTLKLSILWVIHGGIFGYLVDNVSSGFQFAFYGTNMVFYLLIIAHKIPHRHSIYPYAVYMFLYRGMWILFTVMEQRYIKVPQVAVYALLSIIGLMELVLPAVWYHVLWSDTHYWRAGIFGPRSPSKNTSIFTAFTSSLTPFSSSTASSTSISNRNLNSTTNSLDEKSIGLLNDTHDDIVSSDLQKMIEYNRNYLIDFAFLKVSNELLGQGAFSRVYKGQMKSKHVAVKYFVRMPEVNSDTIALYCRETMITSQLRHRNIVTFYGLCVNPPSIGLVFELATCNLRTLLKQRRKPWNHRVLLNIALDCVRPVTYLHTQTPKPILHRDIKSLNYLVMEDMTVKLTDFGLSRAITSSHTDDISDADQGILADVNIQAATDLTLGVGTKWWMSPEMLSRDIYTEKTDVYSLTLVLWELISYTTPNSKFNRHELKETVAVRGERPAIPEYCLPAYRELLERGWAAKPQDRPTAKEMEIALENMLLNLENSETLPMITPP